MEMNHSAVKPISKHEFKRDQLCALMDELVAARWSLSKCIRENPDLPPMLTAHLQRTGVELGITIIALKVRLEEQGLPL